MLINKIVLGRAAHIRAKIKNLSDGPRSDEIGITHSKILLECFANFGGKIRTG